MNARSLRWGLVLLAGLLGVWLWWPQHQRGGASQTPAAKPVVAAVTPSVGATPSPGARVGTNAVAGGGTESNRFPYRLTNTRKSLGELAHDGRAILLANALIDTTAKLDFKIPKNLASKGDPGAYIVQAKGLIDARFRAMLAEAGAQIVSYIPNNAYLVEITPGQAAAISGSRLTAAVLPYEPYYKVSPSLLAAATAQESLPAGQVLNLGVFANDASTVQAQLMNLGVDILAEDRSPFGPIYRVIAPADWTALAQLPGVQVLEATRERRAANDLARVTLGISVDTVTNEDYLNLYGSNVVVEVNDSGIDATHPDFTLGGTAVGGVGSGTGTRIFGDSAGSLTDTNGHGTHVAGIIAGNGAASYTVTNTPSGSVTNADFRGKAPLAYLYSVGFMTSVANLGAAGPGPGYNNGDWAGGFDPTFGLATANSTPDIYDVSDYYLQTTPAMTNALISNNSWTYVGDNEYDLAAASYDAAVRDALPMVTGSQPVLFVFAAGNGGGGNDDGSGGNADTIESPGTAKNVITVGALEQFRNITNTITDAGGNTNDEYWLPWTDSGNQVTSYSARGNVGVGVEGDFGRFKPDVVAPGTFVISTSSSHSQWNQYAYYTPTNFSSSDYPDQVLETNGLNYYNVTVPGNAVGVIVQVYPNSQSTFPFPTNLPIFAELNPETVDYATYKDSLNIPQDTGDGYLQTLLNNGVYFAVANTNNIPINYDLVVTVIATNNNGTLFQVLSNLNDTLAPYYRYETGTSMSAASVSGVLALMQDFFTNTLKQTPSPALLKAMLINGAQSVGNYQLAVTNPPNSQGWGLVNLPASIPSGLTNLLSNPINTPMYFLDQSPTNALATGDSQTFQLTVTPGAQSLPLRVTLVWTDPPGDPAAAYKLVNNVDIILTNLDATNVYYGNNFSSAGGQSFSVPVATNAAPNLDIVNNVRNIYLEPPLNTNYILTVLGRSVNVNAVTAQTNNVVQDFALVISAGDGTVSNGVHVVAGLPVRNQMGDQNITYVTTTNTPLLNQTAGENSPLLGTNTVVVGTNSTVATNAVVTIGQTNQWHFYVVTNTTGYTNAAFITFNPQTMALPTLGTLADTVADATRPEANIDLYVATDPNGGGGTLTNLDPVVISNCVNSVGFQQYQASLGSGGTKFVAYSNSVQNQVYYIGVKSEDHLGTWYGFLPVFSAYPFSQMNSDGSETVNGLTLPVPIPAGSPVHPQTALIFALALYPLTIDEVIVTNGIIHTNFGNLFGQLSHNDITDVLNNHDAYGIVNTNIIYYDAPANPINTPIGPVLVPPTAQNSDGPGSLVGYRTQSAIGPWILAEVANEYVQAGSNTVFGLRIYPHTPPDKGLHVYIAGQSAYYDYIDVPAGVTNLTLSVTNETLPTTIAPLEVFLRFGADPSPTTVFPPTIYDQMMTVSNGVPPNTYPGGSLSVGPASIPPIQPGRYYYEIYNPSLSPATNVYVVATLQYAAVSGGATFVSPTVPVAIQDDAVVTNSITITNTETIFSAAVGVVVDTPRVSDLTLTLVSPTRARYVLFENRGGGYATNLGHLLLTTNTFGTTSSGGYLASTNVFGPVPNQGILLVDYDMYTVPDDLVVYYDGVEIFNSHEVSYTGEFVVPYGPGNSTNLTIIMNPGNNPTASDEWKYTPFVVSENYTYLTFTSDTNLATVPIKFAVPPFDLTDLGTNYTLDNFEATTNGDYVAPTNIYDPRGGWNLYGLQTNVTIPATNTAVLLTNIVVLTNNEVSVVTDPASAYEGSNYLALGTGTITRMIPTQPNRLYSVAYSYRGPGIAGWWRGEGDATDSSDPETNGNNGRLIGRFTFPAGEVGQTFELAADGQLYDFAGTNNYVQVPQAPGLDVGTGSGFTVEGWINPTNLFTQEPLVEWLAHMPTNTAVTNIQILAGPFLYRGTGHYYYLLGETNWTVSERWATNMGGHLVTVNSANEQNWVYNAFADYAGTNRNLWIGLNDAADPGSNVWSSGQTNVTYSNWAAGQPTNACGSHYTVILGPTNATPGLWRLQDENGNTCTVFNEHGAYGVAELDAIPTNGVQLWVSVTNSPATGNGILSSNGCLYANLVDTTNGYHEIWSVPGLIQSNLYQHVALTYDTNTGVARLYYQGTNVCSTNLGIFTPKTTGDVLLGKDMSLLTNNYFSGEMDEMSVYRRRLSDAEILAIYQISALSTNNLITNGIAATPGKFDPAFSPAIGLAEAVVSLGGRTNRIFGDNTNWQRMVYTFIATSNATPLQLTGLEPGMLLDDFTVSESQLGNLYYQPEQPLDPLVGEVAAGVWTLEIQDNRANDTNFPAQLVSWQLDFQLQTNSPVPITLGAQTPAGNTVPPGQTAYFFVPVPSWATSATNILVSASGQVDLLYNPTNLPTGANSFGTTMLLDATSGQSVLTTNSTPSLPVGLTNFYFLGVSNVSATPVSFVVRVDFNITALSNSVPVTGTLTTNDAVRYFSFEVSTNNAYEATFQLLKLNGNADLVLNYGTPLPNLTNAEYGSFSVSNVNEGLYVLTNSLPVPLAPGTWYLGVFRSQPGPLTYTVLAKELDMGATQVDYTVIPLTNNVPFNFTAGPGAALTNFFSFSVTNYVNFSPGQIHFALYNLTGNGDLILQSNVPPLYPPWFQSSQESGEVPEYIFLRTNSVLTNLTATWYLGVPNNETNLIHFTILAVIDTNQLPAFPGAVGAGGYTAGGRGSTNVYHVINLNDDGPGSLRYGVNTLTNHATIVFDVSGNLSLASPLVITNSFLTIAGQTAPGDGITLQNYPTLLSGAHDVILRYLRFRPGDTGTKISLTYTNLTPGDSLAFTNAANIIIDHVSASWSTNAVVEVLNSTNVTVQWSVIADSLCNFTNSMLASGGPGPRKTNGRAGQGALLRYGNGSLSFYHNLYADNYSSSPELGENLTLDFVNNVIYNWGLSPSWSTNELVGSGYGFTNELNYACNYLIATTNSQTNYIAFWSATNTWIFQTNNFIDTNTSYVFRSPLDGSPTGWAMFTNLYTPFGMPFVLPHPPGIDTTLPTATAEEAYQAYEDVLDFAGAQLSRDRLDQQLVWNVRNQTNVQFIASDTNSGGWPVLRTRPQPLDTDQDGLPDYWEITFGLNPTNALDGTNIVAATGYTELETYLNWLAGPHALTVGTNPVGVNLYQLAGRTGRLSFFVTNALNGSVVLTNEVYTNAVYTNGVFEANQVVTWTNTLAIFTPSNNYTSSFTNPASFDFYVTNNDTVAWFGPVTVSVVVSATSIVMTPAIIDLTNGVPYTLTNAGPVAELTNLFRFTPTHSPGGVVFELFALSGGSANLVVQTNSLPVPPDYLLSTAPGTNSQLILVQTNPALTSIGSTIMPDLNAQWYVGVINDNPNTNPITYTVLAYELPAAPNIITLTNNVPYTFTAGPGPALTNFFVFPVNDSPNNVEFHLYNLTGNGGLTVQTNALPFAPLFNWSSPSGNNPQLIQVGTNGGMPSLNANWFLGVTNSDPALINYTILAQEFTNTLPPVVIATNSPVTNTIGSGVTAFYLVNVPADADLATNALLSATGPLSVWFSTNLPPTIGNPNDAELLAGVTSGTNVFGTNVTAQLSGSTLLVPGGFYYLAVQNNTALSVTYVLDVNFELVLPPILAPVITNLLTANVSAFGATLEASVIPNGANTTVYFEYGLTNAETNFSTTVLLTNSLYSTWPVAIGITGLLPGNHYYYEGIATNVMGAVTNGLHGAFTTPAAPPSVTTEPATNVTSLAATLPALVNPNGAGTLVYFAYGTNTSYGSYSATNVLTGSLNTPQWVTTNVTGLQPGAIYHYRAIGANSAGTTYGADLTFTNVDAAPSVITVAATNVTAASATLLASVNPNGTNATVYFVYGPTASYGRGSATVLLTGSLTSSQSVSLNLSSLLAGVTYHFAAVAFNSFGTNYGDDVTFFTPLAAPSVLTLAATNVLGTNATLPALVNPNGTNTTAYFEYGTTTNYGSLTAPASVTGALSGAQLVTAEVTGLLPGATYHYQAVADNAFGTNFGGDLSFTVPAVPVSITSIVAITNGYLLSWLAPTNAEFKLQWIGSLTATNWYTFTNLVTWTSGVTTLTNPAVGLFTFVDNGTQGGAFGPARFYRLIQLPPANNLAPVLPAISGVYSINPLATLVVTNTATDANPFAILTYSVSYSLVGITNPPVIGTNTGIITWTPTLAQAGLTNFITTIVTDNGLIPLSATNSFEVLVNPIPAFTSVQITGEGVSLQWVGAASNQFQIGWTTNLLTPWSYVPVSAPYVTSSSTNFNYIDTNALGSMKFYLLRQLP